MGLIKNQHAVSPDGPLPIPPSPMTWRLLVTPPASGAVNMALDEALMERARETREWVLRVYSWSRPTISLGRNQTARGCYDLTRIRELDLDVVRRPTGGRAILHHREITYSVTAPASDAGELRESYSRINRLLLGALNTLGAHAEVASDRRRSVRPGMAPCFDEPSPGELVLGGRKLAGSAQWRADGALLQHGSILIADDQSLLGTLGSAVTHVIPRPATLTDALGRAPTVVETADALCGAIRILEDADVSEIRFDADDQLRARTSALVVRYEDDHWTWRR
jgi:lipoate-protein ligase A